MPKRILVVEDSATMAESIRQLLSLHEASVKIVSDGLAAWDLISRDIGAFDVVMTDHYMPTLPGNELVQLLREAGFAGRIIVFSGALRPEDAAAYRALGVTEILEKNADFRHLTSRVLAT